MKRTGILGILLLLGVSTLGDKIPVGYQPSSYNSPPSGYGPPPKPPQEKCLPQKCTDTIAITKTGFISTVQTATVTSLTPVLSMSLSTALINNDVTQTKTVCDPVPTVIYNVDFETVLSTHVVHECIPTQHTKVITNYVPESKAVTLNLCANSLVYHTVQSIDINVTPVPVTTFSFGVTTKEWTTYKPTSSMQYWPVCTESLKCGTTRMPYY